MDTIRMVQCHITRQGRVLALWRRKFKWATLPEGQRGEYESGKEAARRVAREFLGCEVVALRKFIVSRFSSNGVRYEIDYYDCKLPYGQVPRVMDKRKCAELLWLPQEQVREIKGLREELEATSASC